MDQGTHKISLERANFSELVEVVCDEAAVASGRDIELEKDIAPGVYADMDVGLMARLVQNLVENAFKYTAEGGQVSVRLASDGHKLTFSVSDNGIGIDKKDLPHIWERFWQADSSPRRGPRLRPRPLYGEADSRCPRRQARRREQPRRGKHLFLLHGLQ